MNTKRYCAVLILVALLDIGGCNKAHTQKQNIVIAIDVSASIEPEALADAFNSVASMTKSLRRGDRLATIPITGDALNETSGSILRFQVPSERQPYDSDITKAQRQFALALEEARITNSNKPGRQSDILGALQLANEEFNATPEGEKKLIILSDFIQDDRQIDFKTDPRLERPNLIKALVPTFMLATPNRNVQIILGFLRSKDTERLTSQRRQAIREFWITLLARNGARVTIATDGPGLTKTLVEDNTQITSKGGTHGDK